eukprot:298438-Rhodomonas_salina.3
MDAVSALASSAAAVSKASVSFWAFASRSSSSTIRFKRLATHTLFSTSGSSSCVLELLLSNDTVLYHRLHCFTAAAAYFKSPPSTFWGPPPRRISGSDEITLSSPSRQLRVP